jgi:hypothetical protein
MAQNDLSKDHDTRRRFATRRRVAVAVVMAGWAALVVGALVGALAGVDDLPGWLFLGVGLAIAAAAHRVWRCPACGGTLGRNLAPMRCPWCAAPLA